MAAYSTSRLNPTATPFVSEAPAPSPLYTAAPAGCFVPPQYCMYPPPPPPPPACGVVVGCGCCWCVGGLASKGCCSCGQLVAMGVPAFPRLPSTEWGHVHPTLPCPVTVYCCRPPSPTSPPAPASRCRITEIVDDGGDESAEAEVCDDDPSPRSVLTTWRRPKPTAPLRPKRRPALPPPPSLGCKASFDPSSNRSSLMICNIPNNFLKRRFMAILDQHCAEENGKLLRSGSGNGVKSEYDFLYVPIDFGTKCNKGYAFVNMTTATAARRLHAFLHGHRWRAAGSRKVCEVVHAHIEGVDAFVAHFSGSLFPCRNKNFLPVRFGPPRNGLRPTAERVIGRTLVDVGPC